MRKEGTIVRWDDVRGFGFIRSAAATQDVFLHARDFRTAGGVVPRQGLRVSFEEIHVGGKGPRAMAAHPASDARTPTASRMVNHSVERSAVQRATRERARPASGAWLALPLMSAYALGLAWAVWQGHWPWWVLPASLVLNLTTFFAYWQDKHAAQQRTWRVPEDTLHLWSLAGGWGGAWFAQQILRHKSTKASFRAGYWGTVVMHCAAVAGAWWFMHQS